MLLMLLSCLQMKITEPKTPFVRYDAETDTVMDLDRASICLILHHLCLDLQYHLIL